MRAGRCEAMILFGTLPFASPFARPHASACVRQAADAAVRRLDRPAAAATLHAMPASEQDLAARLDALGIATTTVRHPPVYTVEESKALRGTVPGAHIKNLFLKDKKDRLWLVVAAEDRPIDLKKLRHRLGAATLSFGRPELLREALGIEPGSVTPFAAINDADGRVTVVIDAELMAADRINAHPLTNTASTAIAPDDLVTFLGDTGHAPQILDLKDGA